MQAALLDGPRLAPASGDTARRLVVLLHGFGADGNDLMDLGRQWASLVPDAAFVSPHAPQPCAMAPVGRQWFDLTMRDPDTCWRGVNEAAPALNAFLDEELRRHDLDDSRLALVGFSQGTMMALHVALRRAGAVAGVLGYSGLLAGAEHLSMQIVSRPPVMLVHGDRDDVIPPQALFAAAQGLSAADVGVEFHVSRGIGHGIAPDGLEIGGRFLRTCLDGRS